MPYYDTLTEDLARAREILDKGAIFGGDTFAAFKLLESFVAVLTPLEGRTVVHILMAGRALCKEGTPATWGAGEYWVDMPQRAYVTCPDCVRICGPIAERSDTP
jgi:hypothetical protein